MGILALVSMAFKASIRMITRSASIVDLGDVTLLAMVILMARSAGSLAGVNVFIMPHTDEWPLILASFAFLYISGRAIVAALDIESMGRKGISAGGAAHSLRKLGSLAAMLSAIPFCISGALLEELLFRHLLFNALSDEIGRSAAIIVQGGAFAAVHAIPAALLGHGWRITAYAATFPMLSGLVLQHLYMSSGTVAPPAIVHWALNVSAVWRANQSEGQVYDDAR